MLISPFIKRIELADLEAGTTWLWAACKNAGDRRLRHLQFTQEKFSLRRRKHGSALLCIDDLGGYENFKALLRRL